MPREVNPSERRAPADLERMERAAQTIESRRETIETYRADVDVDGAILSVGPDACATCWHDDGKWLTLDQLSETPHPDCDCGCDCLYLLVRKAEELK